MYCGDTTLVKWGPSDRTATALRCRSWLCPDCAPTRKRQLTKDVLRGVPNTFLTLTIRRVPEESAADAAARLIEAWRRTRRAWMQMHKVKRLPFFAIVEATKNGWPHLHVMLRSVWIDQRWLSEQMRERINSPVVDIRRIDNIGRAAVYVSKYASKASHRFGTCKRYWRSLDYIVRVEDDPEPERKKRTGFEREPRSITHVVSQWQQLGWRVTWLSRWRARAVIENS